MSIEAHNIGKQIVTLLYQSNKAIDAYRIQNYDKGLRGTGIVTELLGVLTQEILSQQESYESLGVLVNSKELLELLKDLIAVQESRDYILLADLLELQLNPWLIQMQTSILAIEGASLGDDYLEKNCTAIKSYDNTLVKLMKEILFDALKNEKVKVEPTSSGEPTLYIEKEGKGFYFHSNISPFKEGYQLAQSFIKEGVTDYIVYGLGLGYVILALSELDSYARITVYESRLEIIQLACKVQDFSSLISSGKLQIVYDPKLTKLSERLKIDPDDSGFNFVMHYPSIRAINDPGVRKSLEDYFLQYSSVKNQLPLLMGNFHENIGRKDALADELEEVFKGADLYIIAAGPSLDKNFMKLKFLKEEASKVGRTALILATGTVFRKLLTAGIRPDYVIVTDANARVYSQIRGLEQENIPMIYLSTAYYEFAKNYQGKRYMICQQDFAPAEIYVNNQERLLFQTGGSVSTTALDLGIRLGCKRIIFLGLDLSYPNDLVHAENTSRRELVDRNELRETVDINGDKVMTSKSMDLYRRWIEDRIRQARKESYQGDFVDATEGGVRIEGMKDMKLSEMISYPF